MAKKSFKEQMGDFIKVIQAYINDEPIQRRITNPGGEPNEWKDFPVEGIEQDDFEPGCYDYCIKPAKGSRLDAYPDERSILPVDFAELREGRVYLLRSKTRKEKVKRGYIFVRKTYIYDDVIEMFYGILCEEPGTKVYISDSEARTYRSVASDECSNFIHESVGFCSIDKYDYYIPSKVQVQEADDFIRRLGYEFKNGEMVKL